VLFCLRRALPYPIRRRDMQRFGMTIKLKPGCEQAYKTYHAAVWPEVLSKILECNIRNYSIFFKDGFLFSYFEYHGNDLKSDWSKMAAHPKTQQWWAVMQPMQEPLSTRKEGE
jgi:L-rhamnose mutarotase